MLAEQRRQEVLSTVRSGQTVETATLAKRFGVSEMTIRRDLDELEALGVALIERGPYSVYTLRFTKRDEAIDAMVAILRRGFLAHDLDAPT